MRSPFVSVLPLTLVLLVAAQETKPVQVCVVNPQPVQVSSTDSSASPDRVRLLERINTRSKPIKLHGHDADSGEGLSCSAPGHKEACEYIVAVWPIITGSYQSVPAPQPLENSSTNAIPQPPWSMGNSPQRVSEPMDQASVTYQIVENGNCRLVAQKSVSKLQLGSDVVTKDSVEWLTSKVADEVRQAIAKDVKRMHP